MSHKMSHNEFDAAPAGFFGQSLDRRALLGQWLLGGSAAVATVLTGSVTLSQIASAADKSAPAPGSGASNPTGGKENSMSGGGGGGDGGGADASQRLLSGRAWDDYCDMLKLTGRYIEQMGGGGIELTDLDRTEWYRYVTRIARNALERFIENAEPQRPRLIIHTWRTSVNVTNPDQDHLLAELYPEHEYIITGNRGTVPYFVMAAWKWPEPKDAGAQNWAPRGVDGLKEFNPAISRTTAFLQSDNIKFDAEGNFKVRLSQRPPPEGSGEDWLQTSPEFLGILIRVVFHERSKERAPRMHIQRVDGIKPSPIDAAYMSKGLARAGETILGNVEQARSWWKDNLGQHPNRLQFSKTLYLTNGGVNDREFAFGLWRKDVTQALVLEFTPPQCDYWIFQLCNIWQENLDNYEEGQGHVTKFTVKSEKDGRVRIVIAEEDPGIGGNWVDSYRHTFGIMGLRFIKTAGAAEVIGHLLPLQELKAKGWKALTNKTAIVSGEVVP